MDVYCTVCCAWIDEDEVAYRHRHIFQDEVSGEYMGAGQLYPHTTYPTSETYIQSFEYNWLRLIQPSFFSLCTLLGDDFTRELLSTIQLGKMGDDIIQLGLYEHAQVFDEYQDLQFWIESVGFFLAQEVRPKRQRRIALALNWLITLEGKETAEANTLAVYWIECWLAQ